MNTEEIARIVGDQRTYFKTHATFDVDVRRRALVSLRDAVRAHEADIAHALKTDLGKSHDEAYMCEIGTSLSEIRHQIAHVARWSRPRLRPCDLANAVSVCKTQAVPYGVTLIMAPWNYPFLLTLEPLAGALAAGNTVVIKPSAYAPASSAVLKQICEKAFDPRLVTVVEGGRAENEALLDECWDKIFFTGSVPVGKLVMERASKNLTPVTLELGGKSPCIVDETANIAWAARRIVFGKYLNCGQTCVAPDYVLVHARVHDALIAAMKREIVRQFGEKPLDNPNYGKIVNQKHFDRLCSLMTDEKDVFGGETNAQQLRIAPTIIDHATRDSAAMQDEIFGPILPVLTFENIAEVPAIVAHHPTPLALYLFTSDRTHERMIMNAISFGGGCVNDTIIHLATTHMGFGGVGESGMGSYHGKCGFDTFTHYTSVVKQGVCGNLPFRYQPYTSLKARVVRWFMH